LVLTLPEVLFAGGTAELKESAQRDLVVILAYLREHPDQGLLIESRTESRTGTTESASRSRELSLRRGTTVEAFFLRNGIDPARLRVRGLGKDEPIASNPPTSAGALMGRPSTATA
jgi:outer membrane protein OmpA-like peptidoglycan-associated protein